jgi:hypothetical protein
MNRIAVVMDVAMESLVARSKQTVQSLRAIISFGRIGGGIAWMPNPLNYSRPSPLRVAFLSPKAIAMYSNLRIAFVPGGTIHGDGLLAPAPSRGPDDLSSWIFRNNDSDYIAEPRRDDDQATCRFNIVEAFLDHVSCAQTGGVGNYNRSADDPKTRAAAFLMSRVTANTSETIAPPAVQ